MRAKDQRALGASLGQAAQFLVRGQQASITILDVPD
jgi:hypothetical protein